MNNKKTRHHSRTPRNRRSFANTTCTWLPYFSYQPGSVGASSGSGRDMLNRRYRDSKFFALPSQITVTDSGRFNLEPWRHSWVLLDFQMERNPLPYDLYKFHELQLEHVTPV